ncbi:hypothetical protein TNCV_2003731 [Trichonephila clavipes]|nr:hypothetical protein TNCV_2003731 [Trichonephila clavipes]
MTDEGFKGKIIPSQTTFVVVSSGIQGTYSRCDRKIRNEGAEESLRTLRMAHPPRPNDFLDKSKIVRQTKRSEIFVGRHPEGAPTHPRREASSERIFPFRATIKTSEWVFIKIALLSNPRAIGNVPRHFEPWLNNKDDIRDGTSLSKVPYHTMGGL